MTDLQDAILDRLVGTRVGVNWPDGPLAIAAEVVGGSKPIVFGVTDNDRGAKSEIARRLGYPVLLVEAIQGANRGLAAEDDRRGFAMAVFRLIPVGGRPLRLSSREQNRIAGRMAIRVHPYLCPAAGCPVPTKLAELIDLPEVSRSKANKACGVTCVTAQQSLGRGAQAWLTPRCTPFDRLLKSAAQVINGLADGTSMGGWCSIRESARLAASQRGLAEAVDCCVEIARQCGLRPDVIAGG